MSLSLTVRRLVRPAPDARGPTLTSGAVEFTYGDLSLDRQLPVESGRLAVDPQDDTLSAWQA
jgi:hypothetical protein